MLVIGTLVYGRGDDRQSREESGKTDNMTRESSRKDVKGPVFKWTHSIAGHNVRGLHRRRWARAINATLAAAHLRSGSQHGEEYGRA